MAVPNIVMTRIDERLIHGQGQLWIRSLGANTVIVVNDEVAGDHMQQTIMKTVVPKSVALRFFTVQKTIDIIGKAAPAQVIFLIVKTPQDALRLVEGGVPIHEINVGNVHNGPGRRRSRARYSSTKRTKRRSARWSSAALRSTQGQLQAGLMVQPK